MTQLDWKEAIRVDIPEDEEWDPNKFDWSSVGQEPPTQQQPQQQQVKAPAQPIFKWSYDGHNLQIWPVDAVQGRPHHIEVTGLDFYKLAQGRVYRDGEGNLEILVWEDRGTPEMQDEAIESVEAYLKHKLGESASYYAFQSEGGIYQNQQPGKEDWDSMLTAYFGYPVKTKKPLWNPRKPTMLDWVKNNPAYVEPWNPTQSEGI